MQKDYYMSLSQLAAFHAALVKPSMVSKMLSYSNADFCTYVSYFVNGSIILICILHNQGVMTIVPITTMCMSYNLPKKILG